MAAVAHTKVDLGRNLTGLNLTDTNGFQTLVAGGSNGAKFTYGENDLVVLKNDTGGAAVFTFKARVPGDYTAYGVTVTDPTINVANGKTVLLRIADLFKDSSGEVVITCDVGGKLLVLNLK